MKYFAEGLGLGLLLGAYLMAKYKEKAVYEVERAKELLQKELDALKAKL